MGPTVDDPIPPRAPTTDTWTSPFPWGRDHGDRKDLTLTKHRKRQCQELISTVRRQNSCFALCLAEGLNGGGFSEDNEKRLYRRGGTRCEEELGRCAQSLVVLKHC